jgi:secondary thiamine-phosphate synthase enzyme
MAVVTKVLAVSTHGRGLYEITRAVDGILRESGLTEGVVTVFCRHTSASLVLMENADPSAREDLENWLDRLVPENDPHFSHTLEGPDDMPAHIKTALTHSSETIPFVSGRMLLGTWQGLFLWEHRSQAHTRSVAVSVNGVSGAVSA